MAKLFIGTSGYVYPHWRNGVFYPKGLPQKEELKYYSKFFNTVELNNPFYHLPRESAFLSWYKKTPKDFLFVVKVSRFISHVKYLKDCKDPWIIFYERAKLLKEKLGPFLIQLPPNWKKDLKRLKEFIKVLKEISPKERFAFEFRHRSWFEKEVFDFFRKYKNISLCQADSPGWPLTFEITNSFVYIRMHGGKILYGSKYSSQELKEWAKRIKNYLKKKLDVYCYFNNDAHGFAVENAKELLNYFK
jgi:uncharacterized protein YecE (DUF72 family)